MLDVDLDVERRAELAHDARWRSARHPDRLEFVEGRFVGLGQLAQHMVRLVDVEGQRLRRLPIGQGEVEDRQLTRGDLAGEAMAGGLAKGGVRFDTDYARVLE